MIIRKIVLPVFILFHASYTRAGGISGCSFPFENCLWEEDPDNPIIVPEGGYEDDNIYAPDVHLEGAIYKMWYGGQGTDGHDRIHYATSIDGVHWAKHGVVIDNGDANHVNDPSVVKVGETYYMYYTKDYLGPGPEESAYIYVATSQDGIHWAERGIAISKGPSGSWNSKAVARPSVIYENGIFKMWFDGHNGIARHVAYATSSDGLNWTIQNNGQPVFYNAGAVDVKRIGDYYVLVHESHEGTKWALSPDGISWIDKGFLFFKSGKSYDAYGHVTPMIFVDSNGNWAGVYYGAASHECWCRNRIALRYGRVPCQNDDNLCPSGCSPEKDNDCELDLNGDGRVDAKDFKILLRNWRTSQGDLDKDGIVTTIDLGIMRRKF